MQISSNFNRLYHKCFLADLYTQMIESRRIAISFDELKQMLKQINIMYPVYSTGENRGKFVSTRDITSKDLCDHIEFITMWAGEYGITFKIVDEEWQRTLNEAKNL